MVRNIASRNTSCDAQAWRITMLRFAVFTEQGKAIHSGVGERRNVVLSNHIFGQNQSHRFRKWYMNDVQWLYLGKNAGKSFFYANHLSTAFQQKDRYQVVCGYCISFAYSVRLYCSEGVCNMALGGDER